MATTYKKGELQDHEGKQLLPRTKAALVETEDGSNVEEKLGAFLPFSGGTMTGPAVGAPGAIATPQFRNVQYGTEPLTPGESPLPQGTLYITPEANGGSGSFKLVQTNENFDVYASEDGFAILVGKKLKTPKSLNAVSSRTGYYEWGQTFNYTDLSDPEYTIKEEYRLKNGTDLYPYTSKTLFVSFNIGSFTIAPVQIATADIATNQQGYFSCTYRLCNPAEFELKSIEEIFKIIDDNRPRYLMYRYK